jgi:Flp pilus assembly protein TadB
MSGLLDGLEPSTVLWAATGISLLLLAWLAFMLIDRFGIEGSERKRRLSVVQGERLKGPDRKASAAERAGRESLAQRLRSSKLGILFGQYLFFGGSIGGIAGIFLGGYAAAFCAYLAVSRNALIAFVLAALYPAVAYMMLGASMKKKRIEYIKSFVMAIGIVGSAFSAGNSFPEAIDMVVRRDSLGEKIRREFAVMGNQIKSGSSLTKAVNDFTERNRMFEEFSMFGIAIEFYETNGGRGIGRMFSTMEKSLTRKIENYAEIEAKISSYERMVRIFLLLEMTASLIATFFVPNFYVTVASSGTNMLEMAGGVALSMASSFLFEMIVRDAAEG